jgi:tellurite resistance protein TehA-like permease
MPIFHYVNLCPSIEYNFNSNVYIKILISTINFSCININLKISNKNCKILMYIIIDHNIINKLTIYLFYSYKPLKPGKIKFKNKFGTTSNK